MQCRPALKMDLGPRWINRAAGLTGFGPERFGFQTMSPRIILAVLAALLISSCSPRVDNRGNLPADDVVASLKPGVHTKANVVALMGTPSSVGTFDDKTWYYISRTTETRSFFKPEAVDQKIIMVKFDDSGVVTDVEQRGMEVAQNVETVDRTTPTAGHSLTLIEQLFGNIGQFNNGGASGGGKKP